MQFEAQYAPIQRMMCDRPRLDHFASRSTCEGGLLRLLPLVCAISLEKADAGFCADVSLNKFHCPLNTLQSESTRLQAPPKTLCGRATWTWQGRLIALPYHATMQEMR